MKPLLPRNMAVKKGLSVEEWILSAVEEKLEKEHQ